MSLWKVGEGLTFDFDDVQAGLTLFKQACIIACIIICMDMSLNLNPESNLKLKPP